QELWYVTILVLTKGASFAAQRFSDASRRASNAARFFSYASRPGGSSCVRRAAIARAMTRPFAGSSQKWGLPNGWTSPIARVTWWPFASEKVSTRSPPTLSASEAKSWSEETTFTFRASAGRASGRARAKRRERVFFMVFRILSEGVRAVRPDGELELDEELVG